MDHYGDGKKVYIRALIEADYSVCKEVYYSHFAYKKIFTEKFMESIWKGLNAKNVFSCTIVEKSTGEIGGFCQLRNIDSHTPELGIDIRDGCMGRGYAQEAARLLIGYASERFKTAYFIWKADRTNLVSRHIAEKLGGEYISEQATMEQWLIDYGKEKGVLKEEEITYVCTYKILS